MVSPDKIQHDHKRLISCQKRMRIVIKAKAFITILILFWQLISRSVQCVLASLRRAQESIMQNFL